MTQRHASCMLMPSEAASVARSSRTAALGSSNSDFTASNSSTFMPP